MKRLLLGLALAALLVPGAAAAGRLRDRPAELAPGRHRRRRDLDADADDPPARRHAAGWPATRRPDQRRIRGSPDVRRQARGRGGDVRRGRQVPDRRDVALRDLGRLLADPHVLAGDDRGRRIVLPDRARRRCGPRRAARRRAGGCRRPPAPARPTSGARWLIARGSGSRPAPGLPAPRRKAGAAAARRACPSAGRTCRSGRARSAARRAARQRGRPPRGPS